MYKVVYRLPRTMLREIYMTTDELASWLRWQWLRERIVYYVKVE